MAEPSNNEYTIPEWLNNPYLEDILKQQDGQIYEVLNFTVKPPVDKGDNYASTIIRITLNYKLKNNDKIKSQSLLLKTLPEGELMKKYVLESNLFERENKIFLKVLPEMEKLYESMTGKKLTLAAKSIMSPIENTVILEDLFPEGFKMVNRTIGLNFEHCSLALKNLGKFHAISVVMNKNMDGILERNYEEHMYRGNSKKIIEVLYSKTFKDIAKYLQEWSVPTEYIEKYLNNSENIGDRLLEMTTWTEKDFGCLLHGDFWVNNMLFKYSDNNELIDMRFVDFQLTRWNNPSFDILYFFSSSIEDEVRLTQADELLEIYHNSLIDNLKDLDCFVKYTFNDFMNDFTKNGFFAVVIASMLMPIVKVDKENAPDTKDIKEEDLLEQNDKLEHAMKNIYSSNGFHKTFTLLLEDAVKRGFI